VKGEKLVRSPEAEPGYLRDDERSLLAGQADGGSGLYWEDALRTLIAADWTIRKVAG